MPKVDILGHQVDAKLNDRTILREMLSLIADIQGYALPDGTIEVPTGNVSVALELIDFSERADALLKRVLTKKDVALIYGGQSAPIAEPLVSVMALGGAAGEVYDAEFSKYLPDRRAAE